MRSNRPVWMTICPVEKLKAHGIGSSTMSIAHLVWRMSRRAYVSWLWSYSPSLAFLPLLPLKATMSRRSHPT